MDFETFIEEMNGYHYGIVALNTYILSGINHIYIMVSSKGESGTYFKEECATTDIFDTLDKLYYHVRFSCTGILETCANCGSSHVIHNRCKDCRYLGKTRQQLK